MKYVCLMTGHGGTGNGCGHYFMCNMGFKIIEADTLADAFRLAQETYEYYSGDEAIENFQIFEMGLELEVPLESVADRREREKAEFELQEAEKKVQDLRLRLGKQ